jgi:hypothetical protein
MHFLPIQSSNLEGRFYDAAEQTLYMKFKGGAVHKYPNFSAGMAHDFDVVCDDPNQSAGSYFHRHIRHLPNERVEEYEEA